MRAAAYIQERIKCRSPTVDEFGSRAPKVLPDKMTEPNNRRHVLNVISETEKANTGLCSPECSMEIASFFRSQLKAVPLQPKKEVAATLLQPETPKRKTSNDGFRKCSSAWSIEAMEGDR